MTRVKHIIIQTFEAIDRALRRLERRDREESEQIAMIMRTLEDLTKLAVQHRDDLQHLRESVNNWATISAEQHRHSISCLESHEVRIYKLEHKGNGLSLAR